MIEILNISGTYEGAFSDDYGDEESPREHLAAWETLIRVERLPHNFKLQVESSWLDNTTEVQCYATMTICCERCGTDAKVALGEFHCPCGAERSTCIDETKGNCLAVWSVLSVGGKPVTKMSEPRVVVRYGNDGGIEPHFTRIAGDEYRGLILHNEFVSAFEQEFGDPSRPWWTPYFG